MKKINLIEGSFTASEASDILHGLLDKKINFHKLQRLGKTERDHSDACSFDNERIDELLAEKENLKVYFAAIRAKGVQLTINSTIEISEKK